MLEKQKIVAIYEKMQKTLFYMIPEKWDKICLYASVIEQKSGLQTGEMFFYYYPKGIIKKKPINVYEVPIKFNIEEAHYLRLADSLYSSIKELREEFAIAGQQLWSNITITIYDAKFKIEYRYEELLDSKYSSYNRHIIWEYKNLHTSIESLTKKDKIMLQSYLEEMQYKNNIVKVDTINMYQKNVHNMIEFDKEEESPVREQKKKEPKIKEKQNYGEYKKEEKTYGKYEQRKTLQEKIIHKYEKGTNNIKEETIQLEASKDKIVSKKKNQILNF